MALFYLDTSAVLKRYKTEKGTNVVDLLYKNRRRPPGFSDYLVTSHFTCLEVESVAARMRKGLLLDSTGYSALLGAFAYDLENNVSILPVNTPLLVHATVNAADFTLRPGDSIHLTTALIAQDQSRVATVFVSSDKELLEATARAKMQSLDPDADNALLALDHYLNI